MNEIASIIDSSPYPNTNFNWVIETNFDDYMEAVPEVTLNIRETNHTILNVNLTHNITSSKLFEIATALKKAEDECEKYEREKNDF